MKTVIGGSGFYNFLDEFAKKTMETPFGTVEYDKGRKNGQDLCFIPRHGRSHSLLPSQINYRANVFAAHKLRSEYILTTNAVGSMRSDIGPGSIVIPDQIIDFTHGRGSTFFDGSELTVTTRSGKELSGVIHTDVSQPFDSDLRGRIQDACSQVGISYNDSGTLVVTNGPRYETAAEITAFRKMGGDFVGMTSAPEAFLAKELEIPYATVGVVTNYAAGMQASLSHDEVTEIFEDKIQTIKNLFSHIITR